MLGWIGLLLLPRGLSERERTQNYAAEINLPDLPAGLFYRSKRSYGWTRGWRCFADERRTINKLPLDAVWRSLYPNSSTLKT